MKEPKPNRVVSPAAAETAPGQPIQRWSAARQRDVVLRLLRGESVEAVSRQIGIEWRWYGGRASPIVAAACNIGCDKN
jgi:transposase